MYALGFYFSQRAETPVGTSYWVLTETKLTFCPIAHRPHRSTLSSITSFISTGSVMDLSMNSDCNLLNSPDVAALIRALGVLSPSKILASEVIVLLAFELVYSNLYDSPSALLFNNFSSAILQRVAGNSFQRSISLLFC